MSSFFCGFQDDMSATYFKELWADSNPEYIENCVLWSCKKRGSRAVSKLSEEGIEIFASGFWAEDLYYTPNTFKPSGSYKCSCKELNLFAIYSFAIDVDYKPLAYDTLTKKELFNLQCCLGLVGCYDITEHSGEPEFVYELISENLELLQIPEPSYIECGHQLRLIYLLSSPINCSAIYSNKSKRAIRRLQSVICQRLNEEYDCHAEPQPLSSYYRMPGSINSKDNSIVHIKKASGKKYELSYLIDEFLPSLPYSYDEYRKRKRNIKVSRKKLTNSKTDNDIVRTDDYKNRLCKIRLMGFKNLRPYAEMHHKREILTYLYTATYLSIHADSDSIEIAKEFNAGFNRPLSDNEIRQRFKKVKPYSFKTETIVGKLGMTKDEYYILTNKRKKTNLEKVERGETRKQIADRHYEEYMRLKSQGLKQREIAEAMHLSLDTIKTYGRKHKSGHRGPHT